MIDETILFLTVSDQSGETSFQNGTGGYARVNHNFQMSTIDPLNRIFSKVIVYDFLKRYAEAGVLKTNQEILDIVLREKPKYVFWPSMTYEILESTFEKIRQEGAIVIGWFFDDEIRYDEYSKWWAPYLDYILTTDRESVENYRKLGANAIYCLNYSNDTYFKKMDVEKEYDVSFVGANIANRQELVDRLREKGVAVKAFGRGWPSDYVDFDEMVKIYNQSLINLSFMQSYGDNTRPQMKCKIFDICLCGGFLLCEYLPGIEDYYEIGREIDCFTTIDQAVDKINFYLNNPDKREEIAEKGLARASSEHTNYIRFSKIFEEIEKEAELKDNRGLIAPVPQEMPPEVLALHSKFFNSWAKARLFEGKQKQLWKDELKLSLSYHHFNAEAVILYVLGYIPTPIRQFLLRNFTAILHTFKSPA